MALSSARRSLLRAVCPRFQAETFERKASISSRAMEILHQLGELFLAAVPTVLIVFLFYLFLRANFFRPIEKVLAERKARTEGARRAAVTMQAAAQEKVRAYQDALKKARAEVYAEQEAARRAVLEERAALVRNTRTRAGDEVRAAKERIAAELAIAQAQLERESQTLGSEVARAILERRPPGTRPASVAR